jgi:hypothetical protein
MAMITVEGSEVKYLISKGYGFAFWLSIKKYKRKTGFSVKLLKRIGYCKPFCVAEDKAEDLIQLEEVINDLPYRLYIPKNDRERIIQEVSKLNEGFVRADTLAVVS